MTNYLDPDFDAEGFLDGRYDFGVGIDADEVRYLVETALLDSMYNGSNLADLDDYETTETVTSGYIMTELNIGRYSHAAPGCAVRMDA